MFLFRTINIHGTFLLHKRFFMVLRKSEYLKKICRKVLSKTKNSSSMALLWKQCCFCFFPPDTFIFKSVRHLHYTNNHLKNPKRDYCSTVYDLQLHELMMLAWFHLLHAAKRWKCTVLLRSHLTPALCSITLFWHMISFQHTWLTSSYLTFNGCARAKKLL